jgi:hypothetical protein
MPPAIGYITVDTLVDIPETIREPAALVIKTCWLVGVFQTAKVCQVTRTN